MRPLQSTVADGPPARFASGRDKRVPLDDVWETFKNRPSDVVNRSPPSRWRGHLRPPEGRFAGRPCRPARRGTGPCGAECLREAVRPAVLFCPSPTRPRPFPYRPIQAAGYFASSAACQGRGVMAIPAAFARRQWRSTDRAGCCRSSGVEHSLGKGEAESSNLSGSTIFSKTYRTFARCRARPWKFLDVGASVNVSVSHRYTRPDPQRADADRHRRSASPTGRRAQIQAAESIFQLSEVACRANGESEPTTTGVPTDLSMGRSDMSSPKA